MSVRHSGTSRIPPACHRCRRSPPPGGHHQEHQVLTCWQRQPCKTQNRGADPLRRLHAPGPYNPAAILAPKAVKKILALEFVEMSELRGDVWPDDTPADTPAQRRPAKPPVITIKSWLECYSRMAAVLVSRFPEKAPELWAYQCTIMKAAHDYDGANWVAYDRLFRRDMLARKDLNWSVPNTRLYNEAFTGRARSIPRCPHCLADDHGGITYPHNPYPPVLGWLQGSAPLQLAPQTGGQPPAAPIPPKPPAAQEVCRNFNAYRCRFSCPLQQSSSAGRGPTGRSRPPPRPRQPHPYFPPQSSTGAEQP